ncbi:PdxT/SNO family [Irpex lacteus]|nr:PdxT/SNO family [Irpex lacteus]
MPQSGARQDVTVGILALQGAFAEHQVMFQKINAKRKVVIVLVRTPEDLERCDALVIPGGESTTIALLARLAGLLEPMRQFLKKKPIWGTCAGAILLAEAVEGQKKGGQEVLSGITVKIARNGWGSQVESFEADLEVEGLRESARPFHGVFIRAPVILSLLPTLSSPPIQHTDRPIDEDDTDPTDPRTIVALRQGRHLLTTFHPELTKDWRFHEYFVVECVVPSLGSEGEGEWEEEA